MLLLRNFFAGAVLMLSTVGASAATYNPSAVVETQYGVCATSQKSCKANDRRNSANAVDGDSSTFYSLGLGGSILLSFAMPLTGVSKTITVFEETFNRGKGNHWEAADVYAINGSNEAVLLGRITNVLGESRIVTNLSFQLLKLVDVSRAQFPNTRSFDGFDIGKISIAAIPLPATGLMLLGGLGGLVVLRRRKTAASA